jgi:tripeptide aminopeptidase
MDPEKGINAIKTASLFISKLRLGKTKQGIVTNIGTMSGGTANNVVPDKVIINGQVRAFNQTHINIALEKIKVLLNEICTQNGCTFDFVVDASKGAPPGYIAKNHPIVKLAEKASRKVGIPFSPVKVTFGSDANFLSIKYPTLTFCMGGENAHSPDETISVESIKKTEMLLREFITQLC